MKMILLSWLVRPSVKARKLMRLMVGINGKHMVDETVGESP